MKKLVIGCDHAAPELKAIVRDHLIERGFEVIDVGTHTNDSCNYPDYAHAACEEIRSGAAALGILICGTGIGMSMAANRVPGIRAAVCTNEFHASYCRAHNNANVICLGERVSGPGIAANMVDIFLSTQFEGGRHLRRISLFDK